MMGMSEIRYVDDIEFQLSLHADASLAAARAKAAQATASTTERHLMLSYCWAQQEVVLPPTVVLNSV